MQFAFRCRSGKKPPLERAVDILAAEIAFHTPMAFSKLAPLARGGLTIAGLERFWEEEADFASRSAAFTAGVRVWKAPAMLVTATLKTAAHGRDGGKPALRIQQAYPNEGAEQYGIFLPRSFRVPPSSAIHRAFEQPGLLVAAQEDLSSWDASDGTVLPSRPYAVTARGSGNWVSAVLCF